MKKGIIIFITAVLAFCSAPPRKKKPVRRRPVPRRVGPPPARNFKLPMPEKLFDEKTEETYKNTVKETDFQMIKKPYAIVKKREDKEIMHAMAQSELIGNISLLAGGKFYIKKDGKTVFTRGNAVVTGIGKIQYEKVGEKFLKASVNEAKAKLKEIAKKEGIINIEREASGKDFSMVLSDAIANALKTLKKEDKVVMGFYQLTELPKYEYSDDEFKVSVKVRAIILN